METTVAYYSTRERIATAYVLVAVNGIYSSLTLDARDVGWKIPYPSETIWFTLSESALRETQSRFVPFNCDILRREEYVGPATKDVATARGCERYPTGFE